MRAIVVRQHGGIEALLHEELPEPAPRAGEVRVAVRACGLNHLDLWVRAGVPGHRFPLPLVAGADAAGVVDALGADVSGLSIGDPVVVAPAVSCGYCRACLSGRDHHCAAYGILGEQRDGGCADKLVVPRANVMPKPPRLSFEEAAAIGVPFLTAWEMLLGRAGLRAGETVLVQAAGSGVSSAAIQIAKMFEAVVIATARGEEKLERAARLGADHRLDYSKGPVAKRVKELTGGRGADVVVDHVGEATWEDSMRSLAWRGRLVTCGATSGAEVKLNLRHLFFKSLSLLGSTMGSKGSFAEILDHVQAGRLSPVIDRVLPMSRIGEAHRLLEERRVFGRVVMVPG